MSPGCGNDASELTVSVTCNPPVRHNSVAVFTARSLAVQLERLLAARFSTCNRFSVAVVRGGGQSLQRQWWRDTAFTVDDMSTLASDQLVDWLNADPLNGLNAVSLSPVTITPRGW